MSIYLRVLISNNGKAPARNVEVFADQLTRQRADGGWERVAAFPAMNLAWSNFAAMYMPLIARDMRKHCDIAHIVDPAERANFGERNNRLGIAAHETSMAFDVVAKPLHQGHIVGPGIYQLRLSVAAENARTAAYTLKINLRGQWFPEEGRMLTDGVGIALVRGEG